MKQFVILLVWAIWGALFVACSHDIPENGLENVTYNAVQDADGNYYDVVQIGEQVWMRTNLRTKHFRDGSEIKLYYNGGEEPCCFNPNFKYPEGADFGDNDVINAYYYFRNNERVYGLLYNWYAVDDRRGLCPEGWHVPSEAEWDQLEEYVENQWCYNGYSVAKALSSQYGWRCSFNVGTPGCRPEENNVSGFAAVPAGSSFYDAGYYAGFWSATQNASDPYNAYGRSLGYDYAGVYRNGYDKDNGYSVRCLRD